MSDEGMSDAEFDAKVGFPVGERYVPKSKLDAAEARALAAEANDRARILAFIWDNYSLDGCECDHGISPPADCPNENCNARTAWAIHRAIERNEHGAGK